MIAGKFIRSGLAASLICLAPPAAAQENVRWQQSPIIFLPGTAGTGQADFVEGNLIVELPLRWALSTRLSQQVVVTAEGKTETIEAGTLLPIVRIPASERKAAPRFVFCTRSRIAEAQEGTGLLGGWFGSLTNTLIDGQTCLEDTDADGDLDAALALGEGPGILDLGAIAETPFTTLESEPMGTSDDSARISLVRVGRNTVQLAFDIFQRGSPRQFSTMNSGRFSAASLTQFGYGEGTTSATNLMGIRFEVTEANQRENRANISWRATASATEFVVVPNVVQTRLVW